MAWPYRYFSNYINYKKLFSYLRVINDVLGDGFFESPPTTPFLYLLLLTAEEI
jgi:hypothetical protein